MKPRSTIYIIGAGAIGKALAAFLKLENRHVLMLRGSIDDQTAYAEKIKVELNDKTILEAEIEVSTISRFQMLDGIVVLANKSYGNQHLSEALKAKINDSPLVILQNGLNVEQPFTGNNFPRIYRCVLFATSQPVDGNKLRFRPVSVSPVGIIRGDTENLTAVVKQLNSLNFPFKAEENIQPVIWKKAIVNSVFNSVCPLLETDNGIFCRNERALDLAKQVITECVLVAEARGVLLDTTDVLNSLLLISRASDGQLISTYQDIINRRRTEIETLNFAIVNIADELNRGEIVPKTKLLGELVSLKSELNQ